jgi:MoaA/NifB/PqqE/SkfB family radical SAM enzyme
MGDMDAKRRELSTEEHFRVLDELAEMGTFWLLYTGGEIFARKDFLEIYTYAKKKGFLITLFTNGTIITKEIADYVGVAAVRYRDHALRAHTGDVRGADGDSGVIRQVPAGDQAAERERASVEVEDGGYQYQQA